MAVNKITAPFVNNKIDDHISDHMKIFDKLLAKHEKTLYGEDNEGGLCAAARDREKRLSDLEKLNSKIDNLKWGVYAWIVVQLLSYLPNLIKLVETSK